MIGTSVCRIGKIRSKHILWEITEVWCKNTKNWFGLDIMYEFPDDDSFGIETRSNVESRLLNRVVSEWRVLPLFLREYNNTNGWLRIRLQKKTQASSLVQRKLTR